MPEYSLNTIADQPTSQKEAVLAARQQAFEEAAQRVESIRQCEIQEVYRRCGLNFGPGAIEHEDGWRDLSKDEKDILQAVARLLRKMGAT